jgi:hypothetical protein
MHPQAPNTQTFLPACLLPTACDYNGLDCFDPLARTASSRFARDDKELGPQLGKTITRRAAS